jgi:trigger factor
MQVTEVAADGLKREYKVVVAASEIEGKVEERLKRLAKTAKVPGFRPGKVPLSLLKKQYGRQLMGEILEQAVDEGSKQAINDNKLKPALRPKVEVTSFDDGADLEFKLDLEVLPEVPEVDLKAISLSRQVVEVDDVRVEDAIANVAKARRQFAPLAQPRPAADGDQVTLDFEGSIDGTPFDGGKAEDFQIVIGSGQMIPGFEQGLIGKSAGDEAEIEVTFPEDYGREELRGKAATFKIKVKEIKAGGAVSVDDEFAKQLGAENLDDLKGRIRERLANDYRGIARQKVKRALLDDLAERCQFAVPEGMTDLEFNAIWRQLEDEMKRTETTFESMGQSEDELRAEYRQIAERRVRLGLVLSDIGTKNEVKVEGPELQQAVMEQARRYPGQEKQVFEYFRDTPAALEQLRAPIFEDKVVDFILELAEVKDQPVSIEELMKDPDEEEAPAAAETKAAAKAESKPKAKSKAKSKAKAEPEVTDAAEESEA